MKKIRDKSTETVTRFWKNISSDIINKFNNRKHDRSKEENKIGDMGNTHTPVSRLDLTGLNKEQAKAVIDKIIDEKLEMISHMELTEPKIDEQERECQRAKTAERINMRRNRRKQKGTAMVEAIVKDQEVFSDQKSTSVFDEIQPESVLFEEDIVETDQPERPVLSDQMVQAQNALDEMQTESCTIQESVEELSIPESNPVNTSLDAAIDKLFAFYDTNRTGLVRMSRKIQQITVEVMKEKILPTVAIGMKCINRKLMPLFQKIETNLELKKKTAFVLLVLAKKENIASEKMYRFIIFLDDKNEALIRLGISLKDKVCYAYNFGKEYAESHKKKLLIGFSIGAAAIAIVTLTIGSMTAYEYIYNGKILGVVKNQEDVYKTIDIIGDKLSCEYDAEIAINKEKDIRFHKVIAFRQDVDDKEDILNRLTYMRDMKANGHGIFVADKLVAVLESEKTAKEILRTIQNTYMKQDANIEYKKVGFAENVIIKDVETKLGDIESKEKAQEYLMTGAIEKKIHVVQSGETFSEIAKMYGLKQSELQVSNPDVVPEKLQIGQEICLNQIVPLVTVQTVEVAQYQETIPFEVICEDTGSLFKNEQTVKSKGSNGQKNVVAEIVRNNGIEVNKTEISATILAQPVSQVVLVGTKEPPPLIGTGSYIYPIRGRLTSRYGYRWGRLHSGIDLAASIGTDIKAADGGKVIFAGYNGSLGYTVKIDHGGGRVTLYGHCSKLFVKKGDKVYQGQHIADVGNTGRSTGPHVHFEVQINGNTKNPLNYL